MCTFGVLGLCEATAAPKRTWTWNVGGALGPSGMTADHVRVLLVNDADGSFLGHVATLLARSRVLAGISKPSDVAELLLFRSRETP